MNSGDKVKKIDIKWRRQREARPARDLMQTLEEIFLL